MKNNQLFSILSEGFHLVTADHDQDMANMK